MMKKAIKWIVVLLLLALLGATAWWYFKPKNEVHYLTEPVTRGNVRQTVSATGEIAPSQLVAVGSQASGQIKKLYVKLGQKVKKGDLIADIDSTTQQNTLSTQKAALETNRAKLLSAQVALKNAQIKYKREKALWAENATSKADLEDAQNALETAQANIAEVKSAIKQTQIAINTAEADLGHTRIVSPMNGTVVAVAVEEGQTENASQSTPTIVQVADLSKMLNKMQIAEGDANKVKAGQEITFTTLAQPDVERKAVMGSIDPGLTTMSQGSYTTSTDTTSTAIYYYARTLVPNEDGSLQIGMTTQNTITINSANNVLTVPVLAVKQKGDKKIVRVLQGQDKTPVEKVVTTGLSDGTNIEIKSGLKEGEQVVISEAKDGNNNEHNRMGPPF